jgi:hypothetical protein
MPKLLTNLDSRLSQGDVLSDIQGIEKVEFTSELLTYSYIEYPFSVVVTQACDLESYYRMIDNKPPNKNAFMLNAMLLPMYNYEHFVSGKHLSEIDVTTSVQNSESKSKIKLNEVPRYHYIESAAGVAMPDCIVDFKHYFTIGIQDIAKEKITNRICRLGDLYREFLSQRFCAYLSRIGLPDN